MTVISRHLIVGRAPQQLPGRGVVDTATLGRRCIGFKPLRQGDSAADRRYSARERDTPEDLSTEPFCEHRDNYLDAEIYGPARYATQPLEADAWEYATRVLDNALAVRRREQT